MKDATTSLAPHAKQVTTDLDLDGSAAVWTS